MSNKFDTPVLIVAWNRPAHARRLVDSLRQFRPNRVWVSVDGPRGSSGEPAVQQTRAAILESLDWPCEIRTQFHDVNLGCRLGVASAIDWFFGQVAEGIILEDDLVLGTDSLPFLQEMLVRYRDDAKIFSISADNSLAVTPSDGSSYFFLGFPHVWGWATWKRAWDLYEANMDSWIDARLTERESSFFPSPAAQRFWTPLFDRVAFEPRFDSWAWCWAATHFANGGLSVQPSSNLVSNFGFDSAATHTRSKTTRAAVEPGRIFPLSHPNNVSESEEMAFLTYELLGSIDGVRVRESKLRQLWSSIARMRPIKSLGRYRQN